MPKRATNMYQRGVTMRRTINNTFHTIGAAAMIFGILMVVKAAGMADLGSDFTEMVHVCLAGSAAMGIGAFVAWWKV